MWERWTNYARIHIRGSTNISLACAGVPRSRRSREGNRRWKQGQFMYSCRRIRARVYVIGIVVAILWLTGAQYAIRNSLLSDLFQRLGDGPRRQYDRALAASMGRVKDVAFDPDDPQKVIVTLQIKPIIKIHRFHGEHGERRPDRRHLCRNRRRKQKNSPLVGASRGEISDHQIETFIIPADRR